MSFSSPSPEQAVIASGLGALYVADGGSNKTFLQQAQVSLDATIHSSLTYNNILKESCDNAKSGGSPCDKDQVRLSSPHSHAFVPCMLTPLPSPHSNYSR